MSKSPLTLIRLGSASQLTQAEVHGNYAELGVMRSKTPPV